MRDTFTNSIIKVHYIWFKGKGNHKSFVVMRMENIVGQPHNQLVFNRANSLEGGQLVFNRANSLLGGQLVFNRANSLEGGHLVYKKKTDLNR